MKKDIKQGYPQLASPVEGTLPFYYVTHDAGAFQFGRIEVSGPDIKDTLNSYMETANAADLFVVAGYGLSGEGPSRDSSKGERRCGVWLFCRYGDW